MNMQSRDNNSNSGEVFGLERAARKVAKDYQNTAFLMGSSFGGVGPNFAVFDNWIP